MINPKLFVFVIAVPIFTILTVDWYQSGGFDKTEDVTPDQSDVAVNEDIAPAIHDVPCDKLTCVFKFLNLIMANSHSPNLEEAEFNQLCKNVTEIYDCFSKAKFNEHVDHMSKSGYIDALYNCILPYFKPAIDICRLTFDNAVDAQKCYKAAVKHYSGSPEEAECRQNCCRDPSTFNASEPALCGPEDYDIYSEVHPCENPVLDQTMKGNDCMTVCLAKSWTRYAKHFCKAEAVPAFESYATAMEKKLAIDQCFKKCPNNSDF